jgi:hypothetical protein
MLAVAEDGELAEFIRTSRQQSLLVLPLRRHINSAIMRLDNYLWNEGHLKAAERAADTQDA